MMTPYDIIIIFEVHVKCLALTRGASAILVMKKKSAGSNDRVSDDLSSVKRHRQSTRQNWARSLGCSQASDSKVSQSMSMAVVF